MKALRPRSGGRPVGVGDVGRTRRSQNLCLSLEAAPNSVRMKKGDDLSLAAGDRLEETRVWFAIGGEFKLGAVEP